MKSIVLIAMALTLECCTAVPCSNRTKRQQPDIAGIATQVGLQAAATAMEAIQNGAALKQSFSVQGPGRIVILQGVRSCVFFVYKYFLFMWNFIRRYGIFEGFRCRRR